MMVSPPLPVHWTGGGRQRSSGAGESASVQPYSLLAGSRWWKPTAVDRDAAGRVCAVHDARGGGPPGARSESVDDAWRPSPHLRFCPFVGASCRNSSASARHILLLPVPISALMITEVGTRPCDRL